MTKSPDAFRSIGEVSRLVGVAPHVLRYWEGQFTQLAPVKRADGRRYYRPDDIRLVAGLCQVMREEGMSIRGAKRLIAADRGAGLRAIGAARLGDSSEYLGTEIAADGPATDMAGELAGQSKRPRASAVRLARPGAGNALVVDEQTANPDTVSATALPDGDRRRARSGDSLPLFPGIDLTPPADWLGRLVTVAATLRGVATKGSPLPDSAAQLRAKLAPTPKPNR